MRPFVGRLVGSLSQCFACAAGEFGGSGHFAALVDGEGRAERGDRFAGAVGSHALHQDQGLGPCGDGLVGAGLGGKAVAEVGVGEGVDPLVLLGVPPDQGVSVLLFGADVVGEIGEGAGSVAGHSAGRGAAASFSPVAA